jgi:CRP/FNR family transcriptional regulator, cyclic AMP receptor protein
VNRTVADLIGAHRLFGGLDATQLELVAACGRLVRFSAGGMLCEEGASADTFYLVRRGHVALDVHDPGRGAVVFETVGPGAIVGWSWLVPPYRWTFDARATEPVAAIAIDGACLRTKAADDPALGYALLTRIATTLLERLQATRLRLLDLYGDHRAR